MNWLAVLKLVLSLASSIYSRITRQADRAAAQEAFANALVNSFGESTDAARRVRNALADRVPDFTKDPYLRDGEDPPAEGV